MNPPFAGPRGQKSQRSRQEPPLESPLQGGTAPEGRATLGVKDELVGSLSELPQDRSFPKRVRLRQRKQFMRAQREGVRVKSESFFAYVKPTRAKVVRLGITASKKVGKAHERNRCKRLVREAFRHSELRSMTGLDVVVVVRQESPPRRLDALTRELNKLAQRALVQIKNAKGRDSQGPAKRSLKKQPTRAKQGSKKGSKEGSKEQPLKQPPHPLTPHQESS